VFLKGYLIDADVHMVRLKVVMYICRRAALWAALILFPLKTNYIVIIFQIIMGNHTVGNDIAQAVGTILAPFLGHYVMQAPPSGCA
jgi:hypothetical protein